LSQFAKTGSASGRDDDAMNRQRAPRAAATRRSFERAGARTRGL